MLQGLVGGYITTVVHMALDDALITMWAHDEGLILGLAPNVLVYGQPIVGPVVFTGHTREGVTVGLTPLQEEIVQRFLMATTLNEAQRERIAARLAEMV